jgi:hypothetical protein
LKDNGKEGSEGTTFITLLYFRFPSRKSGLNTGPANVGFVVDKVTLVRFSSEYFVSHGGDYERYDLLKYDSVVVCYQHTLKMGKVSFAETFVNLYQNPRHHILENRVIFAIYCTADFVYLL